MLELYTFKKGVQLGYQTRLPILYSGREHYQLSQ